ncbi:TonB-dependent receptor [Ancylomarina sp. 16SWW S1-10-2]|uniref:TonB-dependent receptor n=1 Tax=Ancylomarina sp. 16SWW S1-10-2 TaxID=2499681 RepID=UPI0012AD5FD6|nr:TonB-dependent receptor [Ancylomarina sp. 16SWW S1-10-2]MRT93024.1 TonB-dependent receptor [Ancylomarina sp. 16SWW S1-10-2]
MKNIFLSLIILTLLLGANIVLSQTKTSHLVKTKQDNYIFTDLIKLIKEQTGYNATYPSKSKLDYKKVYLGKESYQLEFILDKICLQLQLKCKIIGQQIAFKNIPPKKVTISGYIKDKGNGEDLIGATCYIKELKRGTVTNPYGFYSLSIPSGFYTISFSFLGTKTQSKVIEVEEDTKLNIELDSDNLQMKEIMVRGDNANKNVERAEMSVVKLPAATIKKLPALMGEVDLIKTVQMLPGVKPAAEGSSGFSVRGGDPDQNLLLLDEAPVYNASHLLGFFSVFNNDALSDIKLYKGDMPASTGGRLASLLDIRMKNGNSKKFSGNGGIGTVSSRLTLEGPIGKNEKTSFMISGRRSYADLFLKLSSNDDIKDNTVYFYDVNAKVNHRFNDKNRLFVSTYLGKDKFTSDENELNYGNKTFSIRWNHLFSNKLFLNTTLLYSKYDYEISNKLGADAFKWVADMEDFSAKLDFNYFLNSNNNIKFGGVFTNHKIDPGHAYGLGEQALFSDYRVNQSNSYEQALYISNEQKFGNKLTLKYGLRFSMFNNVGKGTVYDFDDNYEVTNTKTYKSGNIYNTYTNWEPRFGLKYTLSPSSSVKMSYSRTSQYMQLTQNSTGGLPLDIWFPSSPNVKPQIADQVALGYFRNFSNNTIEMSLEGYYKKMKNTIDFKDFADLLLNKELEAELRFGHAEAYGFEFMTKLNLNKLNGWFGYTWSRTERTVKGINDGKTYRSPYDVPHNFKTAISYELSKRTTISANFTYSTGAPITYPVGRAEYQGSLIKIYSGRNKYRMPDNHRLDLALTLKGKKKPGRKWEGEWNFSLYNAYGRKNPWFISFKQDDDNSKVMKAEKTYLFTFVPSVTYNFKF